MIAIIAGTGILPLHACKAFLNDKKKFFVISLFPEKNGHAIKQIIPPSIDIIQKPFYKARAILNLLKERNTKQVLFIGKVDKQNLLKKFKLDWFAIKILATLATKSDFSIMNKIEEELKKHNIEIILQNKILKNLFIAPGILAGSITPELNACINFGIETACTMSTHDIGQTVIVKNKMVLAVEAIEGTDACIQRGIELGSGGIVVCKAVNSNHNTKFDLPTIGTQTLKNVQKGDIAAIAWKSENTFIVDYDAFIQKAQKLEITLVSVK